MGDYDFVRCTCCPQCRRVDRDCPIHKVETPEEAGRRIAREALARSGSPATEEGEADG